jgi:hypothetical protein
MHRILVVAHKTIGGPHLLEEVGRRINDGECRVHLLVPVNHPMGAFSEASVHAAAEKVLAEGERRIRDLDPTGRTEVTGEVGDANPVYATQVLRNRGEQFDEILVSTLARGASRWLLGDVPRKIGRVYPGVSVVHLVAEPEGATA